MKKVCPNCGKPVSDADKVCSNCGQKLKRAGNTQNKKSKKTIVGTCLAALIVFILGGTYYSLHQYRNNAVTTSKGRQDDNATASSSSKNQGSNEQTKKDSKSNWTQGIPTELVGDYTAYEGGYAVASLQFGKAVANVESDGSYLTYYLRKTNTRYYSNEIKSKRLSNGVYLLDYVAKVTVNGKDEGKVHKTEKLVVNDRSFSFLDLTFDKEIYSWIAPNSEADDARQEKPLPNEDNQNTEQTTNNDANSSSSADTTKNKDINQSNSNTSTPNSNSEEQRNSSTNSSSNNDSNKVSGDS